MLFAMTSPQFRRALRSGRLTSQHALRQAVMLAERLKIDQTHDQHPQYQAYTFLLARGVRAQVFMYRDNEPNILALIDDAEKKYNDEVFFYRTWGFNMSERAKDLTTELTYLKHKREVIVAAAGENLGGQLERDLAEIDQLDGEKLKAFAQELARQLGAAKDRVEWLKTEKHELQELQRRSDAQLQRG